MDPRKTDDSHKRWDNQPDLAKEAWKQFDEVIVPNIVHNALAKDSDFKSLYQNLAIARARCEFEKKPEGNRFDIISEETFGAIGCSRVPCVNSVEKWGSLATNFVKERMLNRYGEIGLSYCDGQSIEHPMESDLEIELFLIKIDFFHKKLKATKNFFQFLKIAARMIFDLSDIPPTVRGSAAGNSQYIDKIAKKNFNIHSNLRPILYDWVAYFETQEQYIGYYVILATIQYLQTIPAFTQHEKFFADAGLDMLKNPVFIKNLQLRNNIWLTIQKYIVNILKNPSDLTSQQIENLQSIVSGKLMFRFPSDAIIKFVNAIKKKDPYVLDEEHFQLHKCKLTEKELDQIIKSSGCNRKNFERLFYLHRYTFKLYLKSYGDPIAEEAFNKDWCELEILRTLESNRYSFYLSSLEKILFPAGVPSIRSIGLTQSGYNVISLSHDPTTIDPSTLFDLVKQKPSYIKYMTKIYFIETDRQARLIELKDYHTISFLINIPEKLLQYFLPLFPETLDIPQALEGELSKIIAYDSTSIRFSKMIGTLRKCSLASWDTIAPLSIDTLTILGTDHAKDDPKYQLKERLLEAIWNGGIILQDLIGLTLEQIYIIADPQALALYKTNTFIHANDILNPASSQPLKTVILNEQKEPAQNFSTKVSFAKQIRNFVFKPADNLPKTIDLKNKDCSQQKKRGLGCE